MYGFPCIVVCRHFSKLILFFKKKKLTSQLPLSSLSTRPKNLLLASLKQREWWILHFMWYRETLFANLPNSCLSWNRVLMNAKVLKQMNFWVQHFTDASIQHFNWAGWWPTELSWLQWNGSGGKSVEAITLRR